MKEACWQSRRLVLGAIVTACLLIGVLAGSASATLSLDKTTDTAFTVDSDVHWFNNPNRGQSYNGYQYWGYWDAEESGTVYLKVSRRRLSDNNIASLRFDGTGGSTAYEQPVHADGHNFVGIGLSPNDGRIHLSWSLHTNDRRHRYLISNAGCMEQTQTNFNFTNCRFTFDWSQSSDLTHEEKMTYPVYFNDNEGRLYFTWRWDAAGRGSQFLNCYNDDGTWETLGIMIHGSDIGPEPGRYTFDPDGPGETRAMTSQYRGVYLSSPGPVFDKNERMHVAWVFRELTGAYGHGIFYAYSDDHARTWKRSSDGTTIATIDSDPIRVTDQSDTRVVEAPPGSWPGGTAGGSFTVDSDNNPHIFASQSDTLALERGRSNQRPTHFWRDAAGTWYSQYIGGQELASPYPMGGEVMLDRANDVYATFGIDQLGWWPWNADPYAQAELPTYNVTWQPGGYMDVRVNSEETALRAMDYVDESISTSGTNQLRVRMRNDSAARRAALYWTTHESPAYNLGRGQSFNITERDRNYTEYTFTITDADWAGTLLELEFHPVTGVSSGSVRIDWIKLTDSSGRVVKQWNMNSGLTMHSAEAGATNNWESWTVDTDLLEGVQMEREDGAWPIARARYDNERVFSFTTVVQNESGREALSVREFDILGDDIIKDWRFDTDTVNWTAPNNVTGFRWANDGGTKGLSGTIAGRDSQLRSATNLEVPIGSNRYVHVRMKNSSAARRAELYYLINTDRTWTESKSVAFSITANSGYTTYSIDLSRTAGWTNQTLYQFRLDPSDETNDRGTFNIDRIYIDNTR